MDEFGKNVVIAGEEPTKDAGKSLGVFIHLYYPEFSGELCGYLRNIPGEFSIYVSTDTEEKAASIRTVFEKYFPENPLIVKVLPNRGWDIAPFVVGFAEEIRRHPFGLKIHAKKSDNQRKMQVGLRWRTHLLSELLGSRQRIRGALGILERNPDIGIVSAPHWPASLPWVNIGANFHHMKRLLARIDVPLSPHQEIDFPSGSMFWFRREALEPLLNLRLQFEDFDIPSNQTRDGTLAHAIERSIYFFSRKANLSWRVLEPISQSRLSAGGFVERLGLAFRVKAKLYWRILGALLSASTKGATSFAVRQAAILHICLRWVGAALTFQPFRRSISSVMLAIEWSDLFDRKYYLEQNCDVRNAGMDPLFHYVAAGAREGRNPQALFDTLFYLEQNRDVAAAGINPLFHYATMGWKEGRAPHPEFDSEWYRRRYRDVRHRNPLHHYTHHGRVEGRRTRKVFKGTKTAVELPPLEAWTSVQKRADVADAVLDVIVPVYRGYADTLACIFSVLAHPQKCQFELIVINDAGPDKALNSFLKSLADAGYFTYLMNDRNAGFVSTANRGIALHENRDVILLNSDTIVYGDWIDRILRHAESNDRIATITPFSNNATICSYPQTNAENNTELEIGFENLDRFAAEVNLGSRNEVPTGVGFCFFVRRSAIREVGPFDSETFGLGYGEENDFCMRASKKGYINVLAHDIFVYHTGEVSFSETKNSYREEAQQKLHQKHPSYPALVQRYMEADPSRAARARIDARRIAEALGGRIYVFVTHVYGGGTDRYIDDLIALAKSDNASIVVFRIGNRNRLSIELPEDIEHIDVPNIQELDVMAGELIGDILKILAPELIHVQSVAGLGKESIVALFDVIQSTGIPYVFTWHDHMPLCHRIQFMKPGGRYCGEPPVEACRDCLRSDWTAWNEFDPLERRRVFGEFLRGASYTICPSESAAERAVLLTDRRNIIVKPHIERMDSSYWLERSKDFGHPLNVAIIGAIVAHKGANVLVDMAVDAEERGLPIEYTLIGYSTRKELSQFSRVRITGSYSGEHNALDLLRELSPHICFLPSIWPETYCYTLSLAFQAGIPPVVFDLGAQAERVRAAGWGRVLPKGVQSDASLINDLLLSLPLEEMWAERRRNTKPENPRSLAEYYSISGRQ